jgi:DHA2 family multidrug resistance protein
MWSMAHWTPSISAWTLVLTTFVQGIGMGFVFIPANLVAFATLPMPLRTDASALLNLIRNIGSAIGVSVTTTLLAESVQTAHASLASHVSVFNRNLGQNAQSLFWNPHLPFGLQNLNGIVEWNAYVIAYSNDFLFMFFTTIPVLVVILLMRAPPRAGAAPTPPVAE